jgi:putative hydrolase of the HAD superfamily
MIKAIIFDLDDTLISEKQYIESGFSYIAKILSIKHKISEKALYSDMLKIFNENSRNVFNRLLDKYDINYSNEDILNFVNLYRTHNPEIQFCSDVIPLITFLKEKNIKTGIITDGNAESQRKKLKVLNAYEIFDKIIITDEYGKEYWKPHPKAFEDIRKFFNIYLPVILTMNATTLFHTAKFISIFSLLKLKLNNSTCMFPHPSITLEACISFCGGREFYGFS